MIRVKCAAIYKISIGDYYYIGMSVDVFGRFQSHYTSLVLNKHSSIELQKAFNENDIKDFRWQILEYISKTKYKKESSLKGKSFDDYFRKVLLEKEKYHMGLHSINFALNKDKKHFS
jgi:hypothetical protein